MDSCSTSTTPAHTNCPTVTSILQSLTRKLKKYSNCTTVAIIRKILYQIETKGCPITSSSASRSSPLTSYTEMVSFLSLSSSAFPHSSLLSSSHLSTPAIPSSHSRLLSLLYTTNIISPSAYPPLSSLFSSSLSHRPYFPFYSSLDFIFLYIFFYSE